MNNDQMQLFMALSSGIAVLRMLADLGGFYVCLSHRRLSGWLILVALGFAGFFVATAIGRLSSLGLRGFADWIYVANLAAVILGCLSTLVMVFGLGAALIDIRQRLSRSLDPSHVRH
jgi:hypothetical protein